MVCSATPANGAGVPWPHTPHCPMADFAGALAVLSCIWGCAFQKYVIVTALHHGHAIIVTFLGRSAQHFWYSEGAACVMYKICAADLRTARYRVPTKFEVNAGTRRAGLLSNVNEARRARPGLGRTL